MGQLQTATAIVGRGPALAGVLLLEQLWGHFPAAGPRPDPGHRGLKPTQGRQLKWWLCPNVGGQRPFRGFFFFFVLL